jgi:hypothetical protein
MVSLQSQLSHITITITSPINAQSDLGIHRAPPVHHRAYLFSCTSSKRALDHRITITSNPEPTLCLPAAPLHTKFTGSLLHSAIITAQP